MSHITSITKKQESCNQLENRANSQHISQSILIGNSQEQGIESLDNLPIISQKNLYSKENNEENSAQSEFKPNTFLQNSGVISTEINSDFLIKLIDEFIRHASQQVKARELEIMSSQQKEALIYSAISDAELYEYQLELSIIITTLASKYFSHLPLPNKDQTLPLCLDFDTFLLNLIISLFSLNTEKNPLYSRTCKPRKYLYGFYPLINKIFITQSINLVGLIKLCYQAFNQKTKLFDFLSTQILRCFHFPTKAPVEYL